MCKMIITTTTGNTIQIKGEIQKRMDDAIKQANAVASKSKELAKALATVYDLYAKIDWKSILSEGDKKPTFPEVVGEKIPGVKASMAYKYAQTFNAIGKKYPTVFDKLSIGKCIALVSVENSKEYNVLDFFGEFGGRLYAEANVHNAPLLNERREIEQQIEQNASNPVVVKALKSTLATLPPLYELPDNDGADGNPTPDSVKRYGVKMAAKLTDDEFRKTIVLYRNGWETPEPAAPTVDSVKGKAVTALENLLEVWTDAPEVLKDALKAIKPANNSKE